MNWDWVLFQTLNNLAGRWPLFDRVIQFLMNDYALTTLLSVLVVALWFRSRTAAEREADQTAAIHTIIALLLASAVVKGLNLLFFRLRPFTAHDGVHLLFYHPSDSSLPSNSVTVAFTFAVGVAQRSRRLGAIGIVAGTLLGLSRVIGGVHYPLDVIAGALLGTAAVLLVRRYQRPFSPLVQGIRALARRLLLA